MARNHYSYAKRQRDLKKQKKREEKRLRRLARNNPTAADPEAGTDETDRDSGLP